MWQLLLAARVFSSLPDMHSCTDIQIIVIIIVIAMINFNGVILSIINVMIMSKPFDAHLL